MENKPSTPDLRQNRFTENKKAYVAELAIQVTDAEENVQQATAIVTALTEKSRVFNTYLEQADASRVRAHDNKVAGDAILQQVGELKEASATTLAVTVEASAKMQQLAIQVKTVVNKCIISAEVLNKLSLLIIRKKALNPLISDELIKITAKAGTDANDAVALSLVALSSVFASQGNTFQAEGAAELTAGQAAELYAFVSGAASARPGLPDPEPSLQALLDGAYQQAVQNHTDADAGNKEATRQLSIATINLNEAQTKLHSLQAGLGAAKAAAVV